MLVFKQVKSHNGHPSYFKSEYFTKLEKVEDFYTIMILISLRLIFFFVQMLKVPQRLLHTAVRHVIQEHLFRWVFGLQSVFTGLCIQRPFDQLIGKFRELVHRYQAQIGCQNNLQYRPGSETRKTY